MIQETRKQEEEENTPESSVDGGDKSQQEPLNMPGFSPEQAHSLSVYIKVTVAVAVRERVDEAIANYLAKHFGTQVPQQPPSDDFKEEVEQKPEQSYNDVVPVERLRAQDVGFFDPEYEDEKSGNARIVSAGKHVIYRDVYTFVHRLQDLAYSHGNTVISVIPECFRGGALMWYTAELSALEKSDLRASDLATWYSTLISRWKMPTSVALATLTSSSYGLRELRHQSPRAWIQQMLHCAKAANFDSTHNQLTIIWNGLDVTLRRDIPEPDMSTTLSMFLGHIDSKTAIWREMADTPPHQPTQQRQYRSVQQQLTYDQKSPYHRPPQQQGRHQYTRGGDNGPNQGRFAPKIPVADGKQNAFSGEGTPDGNGFYEDEDGYEY